MGWTARRPGRPSMQELIRRRGRSGFVGRQHELRVFRENFDVPPEDDRHRFLFCVHGPAGVGKTSLVRELSQLARDRGALVARVDETADSLPRVLTEIAAQFERQERRLKTLERALAAYRQRAREAAAAPPADPGAPGASSAGARFAARAGVVGLGMVPVVGPFAAAAVDPEQLERGADGLRERFGNRRRGGAGDDEPGGDGAGPGPLLEPERTLTPALTTDLASAADTAPWLVLLFDTYERTAPFLDRWLRDLMTTDRYGELPANTVVVLSGQRPLDPQLWPDLRDFARDLPLSPFTEDEARGLLAAKGVTEEPVVAEVLRLSGRLPVLVSTLAEPGARVPADVHDPSAGAVERFLRWEPDPVRRAAALDCALPRRLDEEVVGAATGAGAGTGPGTAAAEAYAWLRTLPFVTDRGEGGARYHDVVRAPMLRLRRNSAPRKWAAGHTRLAAAFAARRRAYEREDGSGRGGHGHTSRGWAAGRPWSGAAWRALRAEELYHELCAHPGAALAGALREGADACHAQTRYEAVAREWARVLVDAGEDTGDERLRRWGEQCLTALADERLGPARVVDLLLARGGLDDEGRVAAYNARGWCSFGAGMLEQAIEDHARAVELDPDDPWGHHGLAVTLRARGGPGDHAAALRHIDRCGELLPGAALVARERGETYRRAGRHEEALAELDRAHDLAPDEPLTLGSRAQVKHVLGRPQDALADFGQALTLWPDYTWALMRRAHVHSVLGDTRAALADLDRAERLTSEGTGIAGERGNVLRFAGRHEEALAAYDRALALDPGYTWALGSRALSHEALGHTDLARADLERALELDPGYGWAREQLDRLREAPRPAGAGDQQQQMPP
ncbi:tetratricopeptide repeat protein [Streptomyces aureocirculatus]|uniref:tetratricopeptide repeat protein n=1 Tax=Streptomyces aureocirculatus TaxID=67275 RepID=UPI0005604531|nr:tetratricopeptide repeat protein [Streptomyces aureocirculatus]